MIIVSPSEMAEIDRISIEEKGLNSLVLMENAARSILPYLPRGRVGILVGPGNNGGDGLVLARALREQGEQVRVLLMSEKLSEDAEKQKTLAQNWGLEILQCSPEHAEQQIKTLLNESDVIVDALFGTGLSRPLEAHYKRVVELANESESHRLSIDIPSGIDGENGQILGAAFKAHQTVTFGCLKRGHLTYPGKSHCGKVHLTQPGFFPQALVRYKNINLFDQSWAKDTLPHHWETMHKGDNGRLLLITGSEQYPGAGILSTLGALRAGAGLVTVSAAPGMTAGLLHWTPEAMPVKRGSELELEQFDALVLGSGLGEDSKTLGLDILQRAKCPTVVDADCLSQIHKIPREERENLVLTPHPGELSRLLDIPVAELEKNRIQSALDAADSLGCIVCFKGAPTVSAGPEGKAFINSTGCSTLAQGGTGDLLAGIIGAYLAFGLSKLEAAAAASYIQGLAAELAAQKLGPRGTTSHQIAQLVPLAYQHAVGNPKPGTVF